MVDFYRSQSYVHQTTCRAFVVSIGFQLTILVFNVLHTQFSQMSDKQVSVLIFLTIPLVVKQLLIWWDGQILSTL